MKTRYFSLHAADNRLRIFCSQWVFVFLGILLAAFTSPAAQAAQFGDFTYSNDRGEITITRYTGPGGVVVIPSSIDDLPVKVLGDGAFYNTRVTRVTIPVSVVTLGLRQIGTAVFEDCVSLTHIEVATGNTAFSSMGGVLFNQDQTHILQYPLGRVGSYSIPSSVTTIGYKAFSGCTKLAGVTIPNSVVTIARAAFKNCSGLTSVTIPASITTIEGTAFEFCRDLVSVTIGSGVTSIETSVFGACVNLASVTIPNSVTSIQTLAFNSCTKLTKVTIPDSVTSIDSFAFASCTGLTNVMIGRGLSSIQLGVFDACYSLMKIEVAAGNLAFSSVDGVLFNREKTRLIQYPLARAGSYSIPNGVTVIGYNAFKESAKLTELTIPDSVVTIEYNAFKFCTRLTSVIIPPNVTSIGFTAFSRCERLRAHPATTH